MTDRRHAATYGALTGGKSPRSEPSGWLKGINAVVAQVGSVAGAARQLGVPRTTFRHWLAGTTRPPAARRIQIEQAASVITRRQRMPIKREQRLRKARTVAVTCSYYSDTNPRTIIFRLGDDGATGLLPDTINQLIDAYLSGMGADDGSSWMPGLFDKVVDGMTDEWYREHFQSRQPRERFDVHKVVIK